MFPKMFPIGRFKKIQYLEDGLVNYSRRLAKRSSSRQLY